MTAAGLQERWLALPANTRGGVWVLLAAVGFSITAVLAKSLGETLHSFQIAFFRSVVGLAVLLPLAVKAGPSIVKTRVPGLHLARALAGATAMMCGFYALTHLPLATATAITFSRPFFLIVLAVLFLGEPVRWRRWSATAVGFAGVMVMLRPGTGDIDPAMLVALGQALASSVVVVFLKRMPPEERHLTVLFFTAAYTTLFTLGPALWVWREVTGPVLAIAVLLGVIGVTSQAAIVRAYRIAEATAIAPFDYARLLFATGFGIVLFAEFPDAWTVLGAGIIVASTVYIARREARLGAPPKTVPSPD